VSASWNIGRAASIFGVATPRRFSALTTETSGRFLGIRLNYLLRSGSLLSTPATHVPSRNGIWNMSFAGTNMVMWKRWLWLWSAGCQLDNIITWWCHLTERVRVKRSPTGRVESEVVGVGWWKRQRWGAKERESVKIFVMGVFW